MLSLLRWPRDRRDHPRRYGDFLAISTAAAILPDYLRVMTNYGQARTNVTTGEAMGTAQGHSLSLHLRISGKGCAV